MSPRAAHLGTDLAPIVARDTAGVADAIREAGASRTPLRVRASGGWLDAGRPVAPAARLLDVGALTGVQEYNPGDLTLTARASTTLREIEALTRPHAQWLPLDPFGAPSDTLGATLATASCGPASAALGLPRDLTLGIEFVDGRGIVLRGGGRVVKNVAGFDLVRLTVGAWGTLGVITEVTVRLRARPSHATTIALDLPSDATRLAALLRTLREAPITPIAMELASASLAQTLGATDGTTHDVVLVRLGGNAASVAAQRELVLGLTTGRELTEEVWDTMRGALPPRGYSLRVSQRPSRLASLWLDLARHARDVAGAVCHATVERGIARCAVTERDGASMAAMIPALSANWHVEGERLTADGWSHLALRGADRLSIGVRDAFDPFRLLNPGLWGPST